MFYNTEKEYYILIGFCYLMLICDWSILPVPPAAE